MEILRLISIFIASIFFGSVSVAPEFDVVPSPTVAPQVQTADLDFSIKYDGPFTPQAPKAEWTDKRQQNGCEEASTLMAMCLLRPELCVVKNGVIDPDFAVEQILSAHEYQEQNWGVGMDTDAWDTTERVVKDYFKISDAAVVEPDGWEDIVAYLQGGYLVMVPMDGKRLSNPYYVPPGPERHMVLVVGYDASSRQFVTHDPGTRRGADYKYPVTVFWGAIRDYPTGDNLPIEGIEKRMIVIGVK